ncbi:MAG: hypothetical protein K8R02_01805 [Anaerohalosphaeraceae bacterium]|nr:hypothetical protein [Anaerohalosphaeraceae bacterium]
MADAWLEKSTDLGYDAAADLNNDGKIDNSDVDIMSENWLAQNDGTAKHYYYHSDGLGSIIAMSDSDGSLAESYEYDVFGSLKIYNALGSATTTSSMANPYFFTARRYDPETGLYYYRARMYSPALGRFLQPDPIGYKGGLNLYGYVGNNPIMFTDPRGLCVSRAKNYISNRLSNAASSIQNNISSAGSAINNSLSNLRTAATEQMDYSMRSARGLGTLAGNSGRSIKTGAVDIWNKSGARHDYHVTQAAIWGVEYGVSTAIPSLLKYAGNLSGNVMVPASAYNPQVNLNLDNISIAANFFDRLLGDSLKNHADDSKKMMRWHWEQR